MAARKNSGSKYDPSYCALAEQYCAAGATNAILAQKFGVGGGTIDRWLAAHPEFRQAVLQGRGGADKRVEFSLYERAIGGYSYEEKKIHRNKSGEITRSEVITKHLAPDTLAMIFWLKNRIPEVWRDRKELDLQTPKTEMSDEQRANRIMELVESVRIRKAYEQGLVTVATEKGNGHGTETKIN